MNARIAGTSRRRLPKNLHSARDVPARQQRVTEIVLESCRLRPDCERLSVRRHGLAMTPLRFHDIAEVEVIIRVVRVALNRFLEVMLRIVESSEALQHDAHVEFAIGHSRLQLVRLEKRFQRPVELTLGFEDFAEVVVIRRRPRIHGDCALDELTGARHVAGLKTTKSEELERVRIMRLARDHLLEERTSA